MRIHLVFYILLLELALQNVELKTKVKLDNNKYNVKEILDLQKFRR
jgi:hypothetical protein